MLKPYFSTEFFRKKNPLEDPDGVFGHLEFCCEGHYIFWSTKKPVFNKSTLPNGLFDLAFSKKCCIN
jgi:hypothetical protein